MGLLETSSRIRPRGEKHSSGHKRGTLTHEMFSNMINYARTHHRPYAAASELGYRHAFPFFTFQGISFSPNKLVKRFRDHVHVTKENKSWDDKLPFISEGPRADIIRISNHLIANTPMEIGKRRAPTYAKQDCEDTSGDGR
jgi:hypothetical protein